MFEPNCQVVKNTPAKDWENAHPRDSQMITWYTQLYLDYLEDKDPTTVKMFLNQDHVQLPDAGHRNFGFSPVGEECVDFHR